MLILLLCAVNIHAGGEYLTELWERMDRLDISQLQEDLYTQFSESPLPQLDELARVYAGTENMFTAAVDSINSIKARMLELFENNGNSPDDGRRDPPIKFVNQCYNTKKGCEGVGEGGSLIFYEKDASSQDIMNQDILRWRFDEELIACSKNMKRATGIDAACSFMFKDMNIGRVYPASLSSPPTEESLYYRPISRNYYNQGNVYFLIDASPTDVATRELLLTTAKIMIKSLSRTTNGCVLFFTDTYELSPFNMMPVNFVDNKDDIFHYIDNGPYRIEQEMSQDSTLKGLIQTLNYVIDSIFNASYSHPMTKDVYERIKGQIYSSPLDKINYDNGFYNDVKYVNDKEIEDDSYKKFYNTSFPIHNATIYILTAGISVTQELFDEALYSKTNNFSIAIITPPLINSTFSSTKVAARIMKSEPQENTSTYTIKKKDLVVLAQFLNATLYEIGYGKKYGSFICSNPGLTSFQRLYYQDRDVLKMHSFAPTNFQYETGSQSITKEYIFREFIEPMLEYVLVNHEEFRVIPTQFDEKNHQSISLVLNLYSPYHAKIVGFIAVEFDPSYILKFHHAGAFESVNLLVDRHTLEMYYKGQSLTGTSSRVLYFKYLNLLNPEYAVKSIYDLKRVVSSQYAEYQKGGENIYSHKIVTPLDTVILYSYVYNREFNQYVLKDNVAVSPGQICSSRLNYSQCESYYDYTLSTRRTDATTFLIPREVLYDANPTYLECTEMELVHNLEDYLNSSTEDGSLKDSNAIRRVIQFLTPFVEKFYQDFTQVLPFMQVFILDMKSGTLLQHPGIEQTDDYCLSDTVLGYLSSRYTNEQSIRQTGGMASFEANGQRFIILMKSAYNLSKIRQFSIGGVIEAHKMREYLKTVFVSDEGNEFLFITKQGNIMYDSLGEETANAYIFDKYKAIGGILVYADVFTSQVDEYGGLRCNTYVFNYTVTTNDNIIQIDCAEHLSSGVLIVSAFQTLDFLIIEYKDVSPRLGEPYLLSYSPNVGCVDITDRMIISPAYDLAFTDVAINKEYISGRYLNIPNDVHDYTILYQFGLTKLELIVYKCMLIILIIFLFAVLVLRLLASCREHRNLLVH